MATMEREMETSLRAIARITESPLEIKEFENDWILFTYDLPISEEGNRARNDFLSKARYLGAMQHTQSVYLMPWTPAANEAALALADVGDIFVWYANPKDSVMGARLVEEYDVEVEKNLDKIAARIGKIWGHLTKERKHNRPKIGWPKKMIPKTWDQLLPLSKAVVARGNEELGNKALRLIESLREAENQMNSMA